jgi:FAD/FMN-containing dehydrogenase
VVQGAQGTLGVVTWATIRLELLPSIKRVFMVGCERLEEITDFIYWLQRLKLGDECLVLDRLNLASLLEDDPQRIEECRCALPAYILVFVIAGYERFPEDRVDYQTKDVMEVAQRYDVHPRGTLPGVDSGRLLQTLGEPSAEPYWRLRYRGNSAEIFFLTTLDRSPHFVEIMRGAAQDADFPTSSIGMYIQPIQQGRACHIEFDLAFDPDDEAEVTLTKTTFEQASRALMHQGAFFSRPYGMWSDMVGSQNAENVIAMRRVKRIFDPNSVMNPGKLWF